MFGSLVVTGRGIGQVGDPDGVGVEQAVGEALPRQIDQADDARALAVFVSAGTSATVPAAVSNALMPPGV